MRLMVQADGMILTRLGFSFITESLNPFNSNAYYIPGADDFSVSH